MSPGSRRSSGGSRDPLNFYCTSYNTSYGRPEFGAPSVWHPGTYSHRSTGYQSNFRPAVYYSPNLDRKDNPSMGLILRNNYTSITNRDFTPHEHVTGAEPLPHAPSFPQSGYVRSSEVTNPKSRAASSRPVKNERSDLIGCYGQLHLSSFTQVKSVHFDTRDHGPEAIPGVLLKHRPLLFVPQGKGSPDMENFQHGPAFMSTEYKTRFTPKATHPPGKAQRAIIGAMENSGFSEGSNLEPITHDPYSQYHVPKGYHRLMGHSITRTDFLPSSVLQGREPLPALARNSNRDSGFSRELDQVLPTNVPFNDFQSDDKAKNVGDLLGRMYVGKKEASGFSNNNPTYVQSGKEPPQQYLTNYNQRFYDPVPHGRDREGWTRGGIQKQLHSGFSVSNEVHISGI